MHMYAYPFMAIRPNALLHNPELANAQLFVDDDRVRRNDMFIGTNTGAWGRTLNAMLNIARRRPATVAARLEL